MKSRFVLHPVLSNKKSRNIFFVFFGLSAVVAVLFAYQFHEVVQKAGLELSYGAPSGNRFISILISRTFFVGLSLAAALLAGGLTSQFVVGPIKRIENWINAWQKNHKILPLRIRQNDKFSRLGELINQLYSKYSA